MKFCEMISKEIVREDIKIIDFEVEPNKQGPSPNIIFTLRTFVLGPAFSGHPTCVES